MKRERVDALIQRVMAEHPRHVTAAQRLAYFEAVHQELAPLARGLESDLDALREQMQAQWREASEKLPKYRTVYTCPDCGNVYRAGDQDVTVFALDGAVRCRKCNPKASPWGKLPVMQESREVRP